MEAAHVAAKATRAAAESIFQSLIAWESALREEADLLFYRLMELEDEVDEVRQECDCKVKDVFSIVIDYKCVSIWRLQASGVRSSLKEAPEQLEQHRGRLAASRFSAQIVACVFGFGFCQGYDLLGE